LGIRSDFSFTSFPISAGDATDNDILEEFGKIKVQTQSIGTLNTSIGPYFAHEFSKKWILMLKAQAGLSFGAQGKITYEFEKTHPELGKSLDIMSFKPLTTLRTTAGTSITYKVNDELGLTFYMDYHYTNPKVDLKIIPDDIKLEEGNFLETEVRQKMDYLATGLKLTAFF